MTCAAAPAAAAPAAAAAGAAGPPAPQPLLIGDGALHGCPPPPPFLGGGEVVFCPALPIHASDHPPLVGGVALQVVPGTFLQELQLVRGGAPPMCQHILLLRVAPLL